MNPKARPRDTISSEDAFARFLLTRSATTPACRLSIVLTILGTGKYRYRWNVAPLNNISSQDFSFRIFFPKPARALLSNAPRIIKIGSLVQFRHPFKSVDPPRQGISISLFILHPQRERMARAKTRGSGGPRSPRSPS